MKIFIVDTNLFYSAIRNMNSRIARVIIDGKELGADLYAPSYLVGELERHLPSLVEKASITLEEAEISKIRLFEAITLIDDDVIPISDWIVAARWTRDVDDDDTAFVALNEKMDELLWTGDVELYKGLIAKGYKRVVNFDKVKMLLNLPEDF